MEPPTNVVPPHLLRTIDCPPQAKSVPRIICPTQLLHPDAQVPAASDTDAMGHDIRCVAGIKGLQEPSKWSEEQLREWERFATTGYLWLLPGEGYLFRTGFRQAIQPGWGCLLWDRSGMGGSRMVHRLAGVIDPNYRGEWFVRLVNLSPSDHRITPGDAIVQGVYQELVRATCPVVDDLDDTSRGTQGFGSTGN